MDMQDAQELEDAAWSSAYGIATQQQNALLDADPARWRVTLERLVARADDLLREQETSSHDGEDGGDGRGGSQLAEVRARLSAALDDIDTTPRPRPVPAPPVEQAPPADEGTAGETELQATWSSGRLVVWAGGRGTPPADNDELSDRLEAVGAPPHGWSPHRSVPLPSGARAAALSIDMADALGWLVTLGTLTGSDGEGVRPSRRWLGRV